VQLFQVQLAAVEGGLLVQLPQCRLAQGFAAADEATRQCGTTEVWIMTSVDQQDMQPAPANSEDHEIDRHFHGRRRTPVGSFCHHHNSY